jgi:hypothetical protein
MGMACKNLSCMIAIFSPVMKHGVQDLAGKEKVRR